MSSSFQKTFSLWDKFSELNQKMYFYNSSIKATHPYSSKWYQWPMDERPIWYWTKDLKQDTASIHLIGNPIVWWSALFAVLFSIVILPFDFLRKKLPPVFYILFFGYFLNLLPFIFISRVAFLYHYLSSLIFGILILAVLYDKIFVTKRISKDHFIIYFAFLSLVVLTFLFICPLTYGIPVSKTINNYYNYFINLFL